MLITINQQEQTLIMDEDGEFHCAHENHEVEYDRGGDGITEPGASYSVYCYDCHNEDMPQHDVDRLVDNYIESLIPDEY